MPDNFIKKASNLLSVKGSLRSSITFWFLVVAIVPFAVAIIFSMVYFKENLNREFKKRLREQHEGIEIEISDLIDRLNDLASKNTEEEYLVLATLQKESESLDKITSYLLKLESLDVLEVYDYEGNLLSKAANPSLKKVVKASLNIHNKQKDSDRTIFGTLLPTSAHAQDEFDFDIGIVDNDKKTPDNTAQKDTAISKDKLPAGILKQVISQKTLLVQSIDNDYGFRIDSYKVIKEIAYDRIIGIVKCTFFIDYRFCNKNKKKTGVDVMIISPSMQVSSIDKSSLVDVDFSDIYANLEGKDHYYGEKIISGVEHSFMFHPFKNEGNYINAGMVLFLSKADFIKTEENLKVSVTFVAIIILIFVVSLSLYITGLITGQLNNVLEKLKDISQGKGDLTERIIVKSENEIGMLANWFNKFVENLQEIVISINGVSASLTDTAHDIVIKTKRITDATNSQISSVASTLSSLEEMNSSTKGIADAVNELSSSAEKSSSAVLETDASIKELSKNSDILSTSVESSAMSINQMVTSIKQVSDHSGVLKMITQDTEDSMKQIDASTTKIEDNASQTVVLSEQSTKDASSGMKSVDETIKGIKLIESSVASARSVIESLGHKISSIDEILDVIDNVAEQTNLLALNAAIIAAQAGEHGKGFAIVADEIKDLADRTAASTKEIANIIAVVQKESKNAVSAMRESAENVTKSVQLSSQADEILKKIFSNADQSTHRVKDIATSTLMQSKKTSEVMKSMIEVAEMVNQISAATTEQNVGSNMILKATESIKDIAYQLKTAVREQTVASKGISSEIITISQMVKQINKSVKIQKEQSDSALSTVRVINDNAKDNKKIMEDLSKITDLLENKSAILKKEIGKFKV